MVGFKNRYLVLEISLDSSSVAVDVDELQVQVQVQGNVLRAIKESILINFGDCGLASTLASFQVKYLNPTTKLCIIRTSRDDYQRVWSALTMVSTIATFPASFTLLHLTGSIRACRKAAICCEQAKYDQLFKAVSATHNLFQEMHNNLDKIKCLEH